MSGPRSSVRKLLLEVEFGLVERTGIEPVTPCLQSPCPAVRTRSHRTNAQVLTHCVSLRFMRVTCAQRTVG